MTLRIEQEDEGRAIPRGKSAKEKEGLREKSPVGQQDDRQTGTKKRGTNAKKGLWKK